MAEITEKRLNDLGTACTDLIHDLSKPREGTPEMPKYWHITDAETLGLIQQLAETAKQLKAYADSLEE